MKRNWLREIRKNLKLTQQDVAKNLSISRSQYSCIENGVRNPSIEVAIKLSEFMNFDLSIFKNNFVEQKNHFKKKNQQDLVK
jgi:transcriptional regulator with XRE-family HTH domain